MRWDHFSRAKAAWTAAILLAGVVLPLTTLVGAVASVPASVPALTPGQRAPTEGRSGSEEG